MRWIFVLIATLASATVSSPPIFTQDVDLFYRVYDAAGGHPSQSQLQHDYIDAGSDGLHQFAKVRDLSGETLFKGLAKHPEDENLLRLKIQFAEEKSDFALARATEQMLIDKGKGTAGDYNNVAWLALFDDKVDAASVKSAQQATMLTKDATFAELHTLACIYAYEGKSAEARDTLLKAMTVANLSEPNSEVWYGFGSIYEQYGVNDAAIAAYRKVEKPAGRIGVTSTYSLAQARLKALGVATNQVSAR